MEAKIAINENTFSDVQLNENPKLTTIDHQQLLITSVINNLNRRMSTTISIFESRRPDSLSQQEEYESLLEEIKVLDPDQWPTKKDIGFVEHEVE